jgi:hypothetical protein
MRSIREDPRLLMVDQDLVIFYPIRVPLASRGVIRGCRSSVGRYLIHIKVCPWHLFRPVGAPGAGELASNLEAIV